MVDNTTGEDSEHKLSLRHLTLDDSPDLEKLNKLRNEGSVRNFLDTRRDLYRVSWLDEWQKD